MWLVKDNLELPVIGAVEGPSDNLYLVIAIGDINFGVTLCIGWLELLYKLDA